MDIFKIAATEQGLSQEEIREALLAIRDRYNEMLAA